MKSNTIKFFRQFLSIGLLATVVLLEGCDQYDAPSDLTTLTADFTINLSGDCPTPCQVCFTNNSQNATAYTWDFGNGQTSVEQNPCVTYQSIGTFTVTLITSNGTGTQTTTKTVIVGDNIERYKRTFSANISGVVNHLLIHNGFTYALMTVDDVKKVLRFNANGEQEHAFSPDMQKVNDMVGGNNGSVFFAGSIGDRAGIIKYTTEMNFDYLRSYPFSQASFANSLAMKGPSVPDGYVVCGALVDDWSNDLAFLIDNYQEGLATNSKIVFSSLEIKRIFRNPEGSALAFSAFGSWRDPVEQKTDIRMFGASQTGDVYFNSTLGMSNGSNDALYDATPFNSNQSFAGVGEMGGKALFFTTNYQSLTFSSPSVVQDFPSTVNRLTGVCVLNDGNFVVAGTEFATDYWGIYLAKVSPSGSILWQKRLIPGTISVFGDIVATPDGGMLLGGQEFCPNSDCPPFPILYKMDTNGDFQ